MFFRVIFLVVLSEACSPTFFYPFLIYWIEVDQKFDKNFTIYFSQMECKHLFCRFPEAQTVLVSSDDIDYAFDLPTGAVYNE